uniref:Vacuolar fusion protein MON1 homolog n=1 Tax=Parastrongyloides trichosuri TaxID=131310 RepID=A0A0N4Z3A3_PARTI
MSENPLEPNPFNIFILSETGRPIFASCGEENRYSDLFALITILVKRPEDEGDTLQSIQANGLHFVFMLKSYMIFCIVAKFPFNLTQQLQLVYHQVLSLLPTDHIKKTLGTHANYDIRNLLTGFKKSVCTYVEEWKKNPSYFLSGVTLLPMSSSDRYFITNTLDTIIKDVNEDENITFAMVFSHKKLVTSIKTTTHALSASDTNIIINLIECNPPMIKEMEVFVPICLPTISNRGYFNAYFCYPWENIDACLVIICRKVDSFNETKLVKQRFVETIEESKKFKEIMEAFQSVYLFEIPTPQCKFLWHFIYKDTNTSHIVTTLPKVPLITPSEEKEFNYTYHRINDLMYSKKKPKFIFNTNPLYNLIAIVGDNYELYAILNPITSASESIENCERLLKQIRKEEKRILTL